VQESADPQECSWGTPRSRHGRSRGGCMPAKSRGGAVSGAGPGDRTAPRRSPAGGHRWAHPAASTRSDRRALGRTRGHRRDRCHRRHGVAARLRHVGASIQPAALVARSRRSPGARRGLTLGARPRGTRYATPARPFGNPDRHHNGRTTASAGDPRRRMQPRRRGTNHVRGAGCW